MEFERTDNSRYHPRQPYVGLKEQAIKKVYEGLPLEQKEVIDELVGRIMALGKKNLGKVSALEFVGSIAIQLEKNPQLK